MWVGVYTWIFIRTVVIKSKEMLYTSIIYKSCTPLLSKILVNYPLAICNEPFLWLLGGLDSLHYWNNTFDVGFWILQTKKFLHKHYRTLQIDKKCNFLSCQRVRLQSIYCGWCLGRRKIVETMEPSTIGTNQFQNTPIYHQSIHSTQVGQIC